MFYFSSRLKVQTVKTFILEAARTEIQSEAQMFALLHSFYHSISIWQIWKTWRQAWVQLQRRQRSRWSGGVFCGTQQRCPAVLNQPSAGTKDSPLLDTPGHRQCDPTVSPEEVQCFHFSLTQKDQIIKSRLFILFFTFYSHSCVV